MDGEIWDEERWESFLRENDRRIDRYMALLFRYMTENPPTGAEGSATRARWEEELRNYLISHGIDPEEIMPRLLEDREDLDGDVGHQDSASPFVEDEEHFARFGGVPVYRDAFRLTSRVLDWSNSIPGSLKDSTLVQFCSNVTQVSANIAKGHGIGFEREMIGGNIACAKRALAAANAALEILREMKGSPYLDSRLYRKLAEETFEVRNSVGLYVQELRRRFDLGID